MSRSSEGEQAAVYSGETKIVPFDALDGDVLEAADEELAELVDDVPDGCEVYASPVTDASGNVTALRVSVLDEDVIDIA